MKFSSFTIILIFLVFVITGIALVPLLPFKLKPSTELPSLTVGFYWQGADAKTVEKEVTSVLEGTLGRIQGIRGTSSVSRNESGSVTLDFDKKADPDAIRFQVSGCIRQVYPTLPNRVSFPQIYMRRPNNEKETPILSYTINSQSEPSLIQKYTATNITPKINTIKGIHHVDVYGASPMEWEMEYDANLLRSEHISTGDIQAAINMYRTSQAAGWGYSLSNRKDTLVMHLVIRNRDADQFDFLKLPVKKNGNRIIYLKDIVKLRHIEKKPTSYYRINGDNTINIVIYANASENQLRLSNQIKQRMAGIEKSLPKGYSILQSYDATEYIREELSRNIWRAVLTVFILLLFVLIASRSTRYLLFIGLSLVANLSIAFIFYYIFKLEMHIYSLAGITVSLSLIKNNSIVMIDHLRHQKDLKVFLAILATTLTAIAALVVAFFLDEQLRNTLLDFSVIVIINLAVSLVVALFLIPAMMDKMPVKRKQKNIPKIFRWAFSKQRKSRVVRITKLYGKMLRFIIRFRVAFILLFILGFGLPVYKLPEKVDSETWIAKLYNNTIGSEWYKQKAKPIIDKTVGGALRLFNQETFEKSYFGEQQQTVLYASAEMDYGSTLEQMDGLVAPIEKYLRQFKEIQTFNATINAGSAFLTIYFKKEEEKTGFPFQLKEMLTQKANVQGGADWDVYGYGEGFSNFTKESLGSYRITVAGYNFDVLQKIAERMKQKLMENIRIKDVNILSQDSYYKETAFDYVMDFKKIKIAQANISPQEVYYALSEYNKGDNIIASMIVGEGIEGVNLVSKQGKVLDLWSVFREPEQLNRTMIKLNNVASINKKGNNQEIVKENQQYRLILKYDYIGQYESGIKNQDEVIKEMSNTLPLGYSIKSDENLYYWNNRNAKQYLWLLLVIGVIFFICSILFESLLLPLAVIIMIPFSYIGVFLTFPLFGLNFDQGGFAAMILLSGITVSSALYIINDFSILKRKHPGKDVSSLKLYLKAYNQKIFPILITILSTTLGLTPFLFGGKHEAFWPALAAGTIGGLLFSFIGLVFFLPMVLIKRKRN